jgi:hypothetical protein
MLSFTELAVTLSDANAYFTSRGVTTWLGSDAVKTAALVRGQDYIAGVYNPRWTVAFDNDDAPVAVQYAIFEAALREVVQPGSTAPDYVPAGQVTSETVGPISVTYSDKQGSDANAPVFPRIEALLAGLVRSIRGTVVSSVARS